MKRKIIRVVVSFLALVPFVQPGLAVAAPQTLGFVATNGPVELKCEAGHCKAEFSSFCLQEKHGPPTKGTPYFAMHTRSIQVTASRSDTSNFALTRNGFHGDGTADMLRYCAQSDRKLCETKISQELTLQSESISR